LLGSGLGALDFNAQRQCRGRKWRGDVQHAVRVLGCEFVGIDTFQHEELPFKRTINHFAVDVIGLFAFLRKTSSGSMPGSAISNRSFFSCLSMYVFTGGINVWPGGGLSFLAPGTLRLRGKRKESG